ncbi:MAG: DUF2889 domain-containing protein [Actinomycetota bacterium]
MAGDDGVTTLWRTDSILPPPPAGAAPVLHDREYRVESFLLENGNLLIQGAVRDQKPPGVYIPDDPEPLTMHHMQLTLEVEFPSRIIVAAHARLLAFPHDLCPSIEQHYGELVGLSIARGFTHKVRELFGGPRGCSHTTALLQAMAPIAMQSTKSVECIEAERAGEPNPIIVRPPNESWKYLTDTCHVWAEDGPRKDEVERGGVQTIPVDIRLRQLERPVTDR